MVGKDEKGKWENIKKKEVRKKKTRTSKNLKKNWTAPDKNLVFLQ